jgi:hypothetical protein
MISTVPIETYFLRFYLSTTVLFMSLHFVLFGRPGVNPPVCCEIYVHTAASIIKENVDSSSVVPSHGDEPN